eukprot:10701612-Lingulodinium_polyedra.AAC.1
MVRAFVIYYDKNRTCCRPNGPDPARAVVHLRRRLLRPSESSAGVTMTERVVAARVCQIEAGVAEAS